MDTVKYFPAAGLQFCNFLKYCILTTSDFIQVFKSRYGIPKCRSKRSVWNVASRLMHGIVSGNV
jgi:hypothetical protein